MFKLIKIIISIAIIGGAIYYIMDYNKDEPNENDFIESTKEFSKDVINKTKEESKELLDKAKDKADSSKTLQDSRKKLKE